MEYPVIHSSRALVCTEMLFALFHWTCAVTNLVKQKEPDLLLFWDGINLSKIFGFSVDSVVQTDWFRNVSKSWSQGIKIFLTLTSQYFT